MNKPTPMVCTTDEELNQALKVSIMLQQSGSESPEFVAELKIALQKMAERKARQTRIAELWAERGPIEHGMAM